MNNTVRLIPTYRQRKRLMMCSATYHTWVIPWLGLPFVPRSFR